MKVRYDTNDIRVVLEFTDNIKDDYKSIIKTTTLEVMNGRFASLLFENTHRFIQQEC